MFSKLQKLQYIKDNRGVSAIEMAILFPVLLSMLMAVYDLGQGIVINQKTVAASQIIADLITRQEVVDTALITDIVNAGELALDPYPTTSFGYDIASVTFDEEAEPIVLWRVSANMNESETAINSTIGLGDEDEGVVVVSVAYQYEPFFSSFVIDTFNMTERAFLAGRSSATVTCSDC